MNEEFQRLMSVSEAQIDEEIVEIVLKNIIFSRARDVGSVSVIFWDDGSFNSKIKDDLEVAAWYKDFLAELGSSMFNIRSGVNSLEICERNGQDQQKLSVSVLAVKLPALQITISDPDNPHDVRIIMIQGRENVLSFLQKFYFRLHAQEA